MSTFDTNKAIIENYIFKDGDISKLSKFVADQSKLHSANRLSGKLFNPLGFASNIINISDNPIINQTLNKVISDVTGNSGTLDTSDGITFGRVLDNDAEQLYFRDSDEFKLSVESGRDKTFFNSALKNIKNAWLSKVSQAVPVNFELTGTKSIMAQTLAYSNDLIGNNFKGSQTSLPSMYSEEEATSDYTTNIEPIGEKALNYTHDLYSLTQLDPLRIRRLIEEVKQGVYAQNIASRKPKVVSEYEDIDNISKRLRSRFSETVQNFLGVSQEVRNEDFYVRRTAEYTPSVKGHKNLSTGSYFVNETDERLFDLIFKSGQLGSIDSLDNLYGRFLEDYSQQVSSIENPSDSTDFKDINRNRLFTEKEIEEDYSNHRKLRFINYSRPNRLSIDERKDIHNKSFNELLNLYPSEQDDPIMVHDIYEEVVDNFDMENFMYLKFSDVRTNQSIYLRPYIDGLTDDTQATFDEGEYLGRVQSIPKYRKTTGSLNFSFVLHANTPRELAFMYKKIEFLESLNYPRSSENFETVKNPLIKISLGDLYKNRGGYITSFSKSISESESTWETRKGYNVPKLIRCSIAIQKFDDKMPVYPIDYNFDSDGAHRNFDFDFSIINS